jgi:hypothetical protein
VLSSRKTLTSTSSSLDNILYISVSIYLASLL